MQALWAKARTSARTQYKYSPLDQSACSIRLLRVLPKKSRDDILRCKMHHTDVESKYTCLSYVWGSPEPTQLIIVDGRVMRVRQNLFNFLEQASLSDSGQVFWIDAICIDQSSVSERNHQVQQMGLIFQKAEGVIAWLGNKKGIVRFLKRPADVGEDFHDFWSSEYWNRAWITQEVALARRLTFMASNRSLTVEKLLEHADLLNDQVHSSYDRFSVLNPAALSTFRTMSLLQLVELFKLKECERFQDRIFSLLALCEEGYGLQVDYTISREDLLQQVLRCSPTSLCWCSVDVLRKILQIRTISRYGLAGSEQPFAEFTIPIKPQEGGSDSPPTRITVSLKILCDLFSGRYKILQITVASKPDVLPAPPKWLEPYTEERPHGACTVSISDDAESATVYMPLSTLLVLTEGLQATHICDRSRRGVLRLCGNVDNSSVSAATIQLFHADLMGGDGSGPWDVIDGAVSVAWSTADMEDS